MLNCKEISTSENTYTFKPNVLLLDFDDCALGPTVGLKRFGTFPDIGNEHVATILRIYDPEAMDLIPVSNRGLSSIRRWMSLTGIHPPVIFGEAGNVWAYDTENYSIIHTNPEYYFFRTKILPEVRATVRLVLNLLNLDDYFKLFDSVTYACYFPDPRLHKIDAQKVIFRNRYVTSLIDNINELGKTDTKFDVKSPDVMGLIAMMTKNALAKQFLEPIRTKSASTSLPTIKRAIPLFSYDDENPSICDVTHDIALNIVDKILPLDKKHALNVLGISDPKTQSRFLIPDNTRFIIADDTQFGWMRQAHEVLGDRVSFIIPANAKMDEMHTFGIDTYPTTYIAKASFDLGVEEGIREILEK